MSKRLIVIFALVAFFLAMPIHSFAKNYIAPVRTVLAANVSPTPSATPTPAPVDSFSLFWPLSAGKTMQSKIYFLKILKEKIRGILIFGSAEKADYDVFLGIKRMLEAEALMKGNVSDLANKTLDDAANDFDKANSALTSAKNSSDIAKNVKDEINTRVSSLKLFTNYLIRQYPSYNDKLQTISGKLNSITL